MILIAFVLVSSLFTYSNTFFAKETNVGNSGLSLEAVIKLRTINKRLSSG